MQKTYKLFLHIDFWIYSPRDAPKKLFNYLYVDLSPSYLIIIHKKRVKVHKISIIDKEN